MLYHSFALYSPVAGNQFVRKGCGTLLKLDVWLQTTRRVSIRDNVGQANVHDSRVTGLCQAGETNALRRADSVRIIGLRQQNSSPVIGVSCWKLPRTEILIALSVIYAL